MAGKPAPLTQAHAWALRDLIRGLEFTRDRVGEPGCRVRQEAAYQLDALAALTALASASVEGARG